MTVQPIDKHSFRPSDSLLIDANVWLRIEWPGEGLTPKRAAYSRALRDMLTARATIYVDVLILSEFVNRYARLEHSIAHRGGGAPADFKAYRDSPAFRSVSHDIATACGRILKRTKRTESFFESVDIAVILAGYETGQCDFNDLVIAEICRKRVLWLVTDDRDFRGSGVPILTANRKMLGP